jgi:hypothetical protein
MRRLLLCWNRHSRERLPSKRLFLFLYYLNRILGGIELILGLDKDLRHDCFLQVSLHPRGRPALSGYPSAIVPTTIRVRLALLDSIKCIFGFLFVVGRVHAVLRRGSNATVHPNVSGLLWFLESLNVQF